MKPTLLLPLVIVLLLALLGGIVFFAVSDRGNSGRYEPMPVVRFLNDPALSHHGNSYSLEATINRQLDARSEVGRLIVVEVSDADINLPILIPPEFQESLYVGQRYRFDLRVDEDRLIMENLRRL